MAYQSLYRRYRPARFSEVRGQEHLVSALRNAVNEDRVGHAYLFSGPRGTGKTSTARILAKVLNCENVIDGEPCCECDSCRSIESGTSFDVHELDAASNNGVEAIRDLIAKASLGTPGRTKVYILDEVHMLSTAASNALLKTLEEPPAHVVFVLATTDPQKVLPTIRSRTQHFDVHLLSSADLEGLVDYIVADAQLELSPEGRAYILRIGAGSARDTLSALDRVVAAGGAPDSEDAVDEIVEAICERDTGRALVAVEAALSRGRNPRVLGESLISQLRDVFLASVDANLSRLTEADRTRATDQSRRLGAAGATRALEVLGEAFVGIQDALDPRIPLEVALVRLTRDDADISLSSLAERVARLEHTGVVAPRANPVASPGPARPTALPQPISAVEEDAPDSGLRPAPGSRPADTARAQLRKQSDNAPSRVESSPSGAAAPTRPARPARPASPTRPGAATSPRPSAPASSPASSPSTESTPAAAAATPNTEPAPNTQPTPAPPAHNGAPPHFSDLQQAWRDTLLAALPQRAKARFSAGHWIEMEGDTAVFGLPNTPHATRCEECRNDVEQALSTHFGADIHIKLVVDGSAPDPSVARTAASMRRADKSDPRDDAVDLDELTDATGASTAGIDRIAAVFPGAELVDEP